ncbi:MAG: NAD(P)/FAD-dependent oxidoreductase [Candidatus Omnitrophica bacterium]|nr:NAD(P)/FAD-dependent oxidoreductase [Candidatus Omnitrophota bacterium]
MEYDFDIICIGLGPAGMAVSVMGSEMGLKVCAIEKNKIGGECMNVGCIPSKSLLKFSENFHIYSRFSGDDKIKSLGMKDKDIFDKIQSFLKYIREKKTIKMFDKVELILEQGPARFIDKHTIKVGDKKISAQKIFIAAGTEPAIPPIPGLDQIPDILTNNNIFTLDKIPKSLTIIGGGAIGCEMAQAFSRLGTKCTIVHLDPHLIPVGDPAAAALLEEKFKEMTIDTHHDKRISKVELDKNKIVLHTVDGLKIKSDRLLVAAGRRQNFESLNLEKAGVSYNKKNIIVNRKLQTSQSHIYAVGDCNGNFLLSHAAMHQGMIAIMNSMMPRPFKMQFDNFVVPWTVFTNPQVSQVGLTEQQLKKRKIAYETIQVNYEDYGAAIAEEIGVGFVKVFASSLGKIYGACIVGDGSGEMINEWALSIQKKIRLHDIMLLQHSFPTMGFLSKRIAETWMMKKMKSKKIQNMCRWMFKHF